MTNVILKQYFFNFSDESSRAKKYTEDETFLDKVILPQLFHL